ncbi:MAG: hypothetical protein ACKOC2_06300 [Gemmatimonadota bacterium]
MPTPAERQALLFLAAVLSLGTGVRVVRSGAADVPPAARATAREALAGQLAAVDSAIAVDAAVSGLLSLLEPVMIVFLGVVVGGMVVAMYLPIFDMINAVQ